MIWLVALMIGVAHGLTERLCVCGTAVQSVKLISGRNACCNSLFLHAAVELCKCCVKIGVNESHSRCGGSAAKQNAEERSKDASCQSAEDKPADKGHLETEAVHFLALHCLRAYLKGTVGGDVGVFCGYVGNKKVLVLLYYLRDKCHKIQGNNYKN